MNVCHIFISEDENVELVDVVTQNNAKYFQFEVQRMSNGMYSETESDYCHL